jgi:hypothetical protein
VFDEGLIDNPCGIVAQSAVQVGRYRTNEINAPDLAGEGAGNGLRDR